MIARRIAAVLLIAAALGLSSCAERKIVLVPTPPVDIRKEPPARVEPKPPAPDLSKMYAEAIARTREAMPRGGGREVLPLWKALEGTPWGTDAIFHQGVLLQLAGDEEAAAAQYRRITDNAALFEPAAANLLGIYLLRGESEKARVLVDRVLPPGHAPVPAMLPELQANIAAVLVDLGEYERASRLSLALKANRTVAPSLPWNLAVLSYRGGNVSEARRLASEIPPDIANLWPVVASRYAWDREAEKVPALDNVTGARPRMAALSRNLAAYVLYRNGNAAAAENILKETAGDRRDHAEILANIGLVEAVQGKWKEARTHLEQSVKIKPGMPEGWINLGIFREVYEGDLPGALECYEKYVKIGGWRKDEVRKWIEGLRPSPASGP